MLFNNNFVELRVVCI